MVGIRVTTREEFLSAFKEWTNESDTNSLRLDSNPTHFQNLESFQRIIDLGKEAMPFIIEKLREGHFLLNHAMGEITHIDIINLRRSRMDFLSEQAISNLWIEWWEDNSKKSKIDISIAPWALPREEIPIHIRISKEITPRLKNIKIDLPDCFKLVDMINVVKHNISDNILTIQLIGKAKKSDYDYFGVVIASIEPFQELKKQIPINIEFEYYDGAHEKCIKNARIFRPELKFESVPEKIILKDAQKTETKIPVNMKFTGFGKIKIRSECKIGGEIVSIGTSLLDEIVRRIVTEGIFPKDEKIDKGVTIDQNYIEQVVTELRDNYQTNKDLQRIIDEQKFKKSEINQMYRFSKENQEKIIAMYYKRSVEGHLVQIVSEILKRNLSNNSQIESPTAIDTSIKLPSTNVTIIFYYKDVLENEYPPIEKTIEIIDKRTNPTGINVKIPVEIIKVDESDAYKYVEGMVIGTS